MRISQGTAFGVLVAVAAVVGIALAATIRGTNGDDVLVGTSGPDTIRGLAGNDTILWRRRGR
jgi:Ca2+-binding RTX toxin-like protein